MASSARPMAQLMACSTRSTGDRSDIGQTTHLAARMEQMAMPGSILLTPAVLALVQVES